jgi:lipooligosaccharide transport system permease protein
VWRKLMIPSLSTNMAEPIIFLLGFGYGVGALVGEVNGVPYLQYIAAGIVCYGAMNAASFEALYSAFTRMHVQKTWQSILNAPMLLDDILIGEWLWAACKGVVAGLAMTLAMLLLADVALFALPPLFLALAATALAFSATGLAVNAIAPGYDFFSYYFTIFITPMMMLSGAFFPVEVLPQAARAVAAVLPLTAAVELTQGIINGGATAGVWAKNLGILAAYTTGGVYIAAILTRRRLEK